MKMLRPFDPYDPEYWKEKLAEDKKGFLKTKGMWEITEDVPVRRIPWLEMRWRRLKEWWFQNWIEVVTVFGTLSYIGLMCWIFVMVTRE